MKATKALYCLLKVNQAHTDVGRCWVFSRFYQQSKCIYFVASCFASRHPFRKITRCGVSGKSIKFIALRIQLYAWFYAVLPVEEIVGGITFGSPEKKVLQRTSSQSLVVVFQSRVGMLYKVEREIQSRKNFFFCECKFILWHRNDGRGVKGAERSISGMNDWNVCVDGWHPLSPFENPAIWSQSTNGGQKVLQCFCKIIHLSAQLESCRCDDGKSFARSRFRNAFYCFRCITDGMWADCTNWRAKFRAELAAFFIWKFF